MASETLSLRTVLAFVVGFALSWTLNAVVGSAAGCGVLS